MSDLVVIVYPTEAKAEEIGRSYSICRRNM